MSDNKKIAIDPSAFGFLDVAYTKIVTNSDIRKSFDEYIGSGFCADMDYLKRNVDKRTDPSLLVEGASTIVCFLASYGKANGGVAGFAQGEDYHSAIKRKLFEVISFLKQESSRMGLSSFSARAFVDSAPVAERFWAARSGLGFIGRNGFLISPQFGLRTIIGEIICNLPFELFAGRRPLAVTSCGDCGRCAEACPSKALQWQKDGFSLVDARKCISYHTIESHSTAGHPVDFNGWIFGCEECLDVCPWNKEVPSWEELKKNSGYLLNLSRREWADMGSDEFNVHFGDSGLKRAGLDKIKSNL